MIVYWNLKQNTKKIYFNVKINFKSLFINICLQLFKLMYVNFFFFQHVSIVVSVLTLTVISIERWYAICYPLKFRATMRRAVWLIAIIWVFALGISLTQVIDMQAKHYKNLPEHVLLLTECANTWDKNVVLTMKYVEFWILFVLPFLWMVIAYGMISYKLWMASAPGNQSK